MSRRTAEEERDEKEEGEGVGAQKSTKFAHPCGRRGSSTLTTRAAMSSNFWVWYNESLMHYKTHG